MLGKNECHETYFRIDSLGSPLATCLRFSFVKTDLGLCSISFETYAERPQIWPGLVVNDLRFALNLSWKTWDMVGTRHQWLKFPIVDLEDLQFYLDWCQIRHWLVMNDLVFDLPQMTWVLRQSRLGFDSSGLTWGLQLTCPEWPGTIFNELSVGTCSELRDLAVTCVKSCTSNLAKLSHTGLGPVSVDSSQITLDLTWTTPLTLQ